MHLWLLLRFFQKGKEAGLLDGRSQGFHDARTLGFQTGLDLWEEFGFYDSWCLLWLSFSPEGKIKDRLQILRELLDSLPLPSTKNLPSEIIPHEDSRIGVDTNLVEFLSKIRLKYRMACVVLRIKPKSFSAEGSD
jgi:hypothetical protein